MTKMELPYMCFILNSLSSIILFNVFSSSIVNANGIFSQHIDPTKYLATVYFHKEEAFFPVAFDFDTTRDGNHDGKPDVEDNLENYTRCRIGNNIYNECCDIILSQPNDQRLAVYFHHSISQDGYDVYEYWYYYAGDVWINRHEHDWETYFVYERYGIPIYIKYFAHQYCKTFSWSDVVVDGIYHPKITVTCGSHAIGLFNEKNSTDDDWTIIRYDGTIKSSENSLTNSFPSKWVIYPNYEDVIQAYSYKQTPKIFAHGDPCFGKKEYSGPRPAPWVRYEWNKPPPSSKEISKRLIEGITGIMEKGFHDIFSINDSYTCILLPISTIAIRNKIYIDKDEVKNRLKPFPLDIMVQKKIQVSNERQSFVQRYGYTIGILSLEFLTAYVINAQDWENEIQVDRAKTVLLLTKACLYSVSLSEIANKSIGRKRPNGIDNLSFFSGNTSLAFASASILSRDICRVCRELTGVDKYILELAGFGTYVGAAYVGLSAIKHGEHYLSDVLFGAIIGACLGNSIYSNHLNDENKLKSINCSNTSQKSNNTILSFDGAKFSLSSRF
jgi:hypothetical protein